MNYVQLTLSSLRKPAWMRTRNTRRFVKVILFKRFLRNSYINKLAYLNDRVVFK